MNVRQKALLLLPALLLLLIASCKNSEKVDDPHENWKERNAQWFAEVYDAAQASIAAAKAQYPNGNDWEKHCDWRVFKTLLKSQETQGATTDYIVCKINERGDGDWSAAYTDSVRLYYRGWIMDENYPASKTNMTVFSQTYYGDFDKTTAAPLAMPVLSTVEGFMTMAPFSENPEDARPFFRKLRELRDSIEKRLGAKLPRLSMGMSGDYEVAVEEGATWVRLGTILFGEREKIRSVRAEADESFGTGVGLDSYSGAGPTVRILD